MFDLSINLSGFKCGACVKLTKSIIGKINGVKNVEVDISGKTLVTSERAIAIEEIKNALSDTDFRIV
jgi:copper chaperone CopZ